MGSDFVGVGSAGVFAGPFGAPCSGAGRFNMRMAPVWLSARTGSASAINCSILFIGVEGRAGPVDAAGGGVSGGASAGMVGQTGGRRTMPCMAGNVRVDSSLGAALSGAGVGAGCGPNVTGTGLIAGGWGSAGAGFGLSGAGCETGESLASGRDFLALKKMSGHCMVVNQFGQSVRFPPRAIRMMTRDLNVKAFPKTRQAFGGRRPPGDGVFLRFHELNRRPARSCGVRLLPGFRPWHITCLNIPNHVLLLPFTSHLIVIMPVLSGIFETSNLTEILRIIVDAKQTGYLKIKEGEQEGFLAVENGIILHARAGSDTGLHALFHFVAWREARFDFHERPMPADLSRDLAVYDPQVLITGVAFKVDELTLLHEAIPGLDSVLCYAGGEGLASVEVTSADLGLLALADGHRTVREIAQQVNMNPMEIARNLARFRLAGVLEVVTPPASRAKAAMVAAG
jgi:hypothetical protein